MRIAGKVKTSGASLGVVGLGREVDRELLEAVAESAGGTFARAVSASSLPAIMAREIGGAQPRYSTEIEIDLNLAPAASLAQTDDPPPPPTGGDEVAEETEELSLPPRMLRLRSGDILWGAVIEHDPEGIRFPFDEHTSYTAAAVLLAVDAITSATAASGLFGAA